MGSRPSASTMTSPIKITDLPAEILERFAPDLEPRTLSELRLVSRRFRDTFCVDKFYRGYVRYTADDGQPGRWRQRLEEDKRLLAAWRSGRATRADVCRVPPEMLEGISPSQRKFCWEGVEGERGDHYLMCSFRDYGRKILLVNATGAPTLKVVDVDPYTDMWPGAHIYLLPDQLVIIYYQKLEVFNILNDKNGLSLEKLFTIDDVKSILITTGKSAVRNSALHSLLIEYFRDSVLKIWDLKRAVRLKDIDLREILPSRVSSSIHDWKFSIHNIEFPLVTILFVDHHIAIVNVDEGQLVFWFTPENPRSVYKFGLTGNTLLIIANSNYNGDNYCDVRLFDYRTMRTTLDESVPFFRYESNDACYLDYHPPTLVLCNSMTGHQLIKKIHVINTLLPETDWRVIDMSSMNIRTCYFFGPFLFVSGDNVTRVLDTAGQKIFDFDDMLERLDKSYRNENFTLVRKGCNCFFGSMSNFVEFSSLSKCVLENDEKLLICYF